MDPQLAGCWRLQAQRYMFDDGQKGDGLNDCVVEYGAGVAHGRCHFANGQESDTTTHWESSGPGHLHYLSTNPVPDAEYHIDSNFLTTFQAMPQPAPGTGKTKHRALSLARVWVRELSDCNPRGASMLWNGRVKSSLKLSVPSGWQALTSSIDDTWLGPIGWPVGFFFNGSDGPAQVRMVVIDNTRYGATPVLETQFSEARRDIRKEFGSSIRCDEDARICAIKRQPDGSLAWNEWVPVHGRLVLIVATRRPDGTANEATLEEASDLFAKQLLADNEDAPH